MAGDLIPPPSPAGRPEPDSSDKAAREAGGLWAGEGAPPADPVATAVEETAPEQARPAAEPPFRARFGFVMGTLIGVALAAVGLGVALATRGPELPPPVDTWSAWKPTASDDLGIAQQIADYVMPRYLLDGRPLVGIDASPLEVQGATLDGVALATGDDVDFLEGDAILYTLNGLGDMGSIRRGTPSVARSTLVRREALELALYTFHYAKDVDMVVAFLPPSKDDVAKAREQDKALQLTAMLLRPEELRDRLQAPLAATIAPRTPKLTELTPDHPETKLVTVLTEPNVFAATFQQAQDAKTYLVLEKPPRS